MTSEEEDCYYSDYSDHDSLQGIEDAVEDDVQTHSIQVVTKESLLEAQREDLRRVMDMLKLSERHARTLLIHHRWNFERLSTELVEKGRDSLFAEAGVTIAECKKRALPLSYSRSRSLVKCNICIEDVSPHAVTTMDCSHCFCNDCWTEHFIVQINDGQSKHIRCMEHKCNAICDEAVVRNLVSAKYPDIAERFDRHLLESYIVDNNKVKWCPSVPHCGNAIRVEGDSYCEVECTCGLQFCFNCSLEAHSPCSCQMWELWAKKCQDESETVNWITVKTKPCPKCFKNVEKNGGCNLVTCICKQVFCWLCGGASGREHFCGRDKQVTSVKAARAQRDLHRYMHYYNRYKAHTDSLKLESKLKATIQDRIYFSESKESGLRDHSWAMKGLHRLFRSRRILSYSYPFAFYMFGEDLFNDEMTREELELKQNLFENQQEQLEVNVERLSMSLEQPFDVLPKDKVWEVRMQIINLTTLIDKLCKKMYECIDNDLLGALTRMLNIAPYKSMGVERASELSVSLDSNPSSMSMEACNSDSYLQQDSPANKAGMNSSTTKSPLGACLDLGKVVSFTSTQEKSTCPSFVNLPMHGKLGMFGLFFFVSLLVHPLSVHTSLLATPTWESMPRPQC